MILHVFISSDLKAQVRFSFSDRLLSGVRLSVCSSDRLPVNFDSFKLAK
jgi:hypothetical protein